MEDVRDTLETFGIGAANGIAWIQHHYGGILTTTLTVIYLGYRIYKTRQEAEKARLEKEFVKSQLAEWEKLNVKNNVSTE